MNQVSPREVLAEIVDAIPEECQKNMIIIDSLAVGYHFFAENENMVVRTKDADCLLSPRIEAVHARGSNCRKTFCIRLVFIQNWRLGSASRY